MARARTDRTSALAFDAITVEGALISPAVVARVAQHGAGGQTDADYGIPKGLTLRDEIARYFRIGQAMFKELMVTDTPSTTATVNFTEQLLRDVLGFADIRRVGTRTVGDRQFTITLECLGGRVPVVVVPPADDIDRPSTHLTTDGRRRSAASALQDWLNAGETALWGLCTNGIRLRLVRDNASLTRPAYIEADLRRIFESDAFADFAALWLLIHSSRFGRIGTQPSDCALERWRGTGQKEGVTARDKLRDGVEAALLSLGNGFLSHANNVALREKLQTGELPLPEFFSQLLRFVYRLIFLLAAEDRNLLHPPDTAAEPRRLYAEGYSVGALRDRAVRRSAWNRHYDRWEGLLVTFIALAKGEKRLGLPALGGLFASVVIANLESARLTNRNLMEAIFRLAWLREPSGLVPVNWRDMETEELGSVYESLLELTPQLTNNGHGFAFAEGGEAMGHARKSSGSYYTPDSLVQALLDSALDPVLDRVEAEASDPSPALLSVTVLDPACGSGHFLLAAARRIATRVARSRTGGVASPADYRHALRDVVRACIFGVDRNPMAVELCKVALWIEALEPGKPLTFLDSHIRCGDSLIGVFDINVLGYGIPDDAFKQQLGDEKDAASHYRDKNSREVKEREKVESGLGLAAGQTELSKAFASLQTRPEDSLEDIEAKRRLFDGLVARDGPTWKLKTACDLWTAAWFAPKTKMPIRGRELVPTSGQVWEYLRGIALYGPLIAEADRCGHAYHFFHWPVEFPDIIANGGFDVVIGNPPWEMPEADDREFFASRIPSISAEPSAQKRRSLIDALSKTSPREHDHWVQYVRGHAGSRSFFTESGRFPNGAHGRLNYYKLFLEFGFLAVSKSRRLGMVIPSGLTTNAYERPLWHGLVKNGFVSAIYDFENSEGIFQGIDGRVKFSLITLAKQSQSNFRTACWLVDVSELQEPNRVTSLRVDDLSVFSPDELALPQFRQKADLDLLAFATRHHGQLSAHEDWSYTPRLMFSSSDDAFKPVRLAGLTHHPLTHQNRMITEAGTVLVPVYEGKMVGILDHRQADIYLNPNNVARQAQERPIPDAEKIAADRFAVPQFWLEEAAVRQRRFGKSQGDWELVFCDVTSATNERTAIASIVPLSGLTRSLPSIYLRSASAKDATLLVGALSTFAVDYFARLKVSSNHLTQGILATLPIPSRTRILEFSERTFADPLWFDNRILELVYVAWDLENFARDLGCGTPPFRWNPDRRFLLRCEIDAAFFQLFFGSREEWSTLGLNEVFPTPCGAVEYIMDSFTTVNRKDEARFGGDRRTKRIVLEIYDEIATAKQTGSAYQTRLNPIPADPSCCHAPNSKAAASSRQPQGAI